MKKNAESIEEKITEDKVIDVLLHFYHESSEFSRHFHKLEWEIGSIFIGFSLALFGIAISIEKYFIPLALASMGIICLWAVFVWYRLTMYDTVHVEILKKIETRLQELFPNYDFIKPNSEFTFILFDQFRWKASMVRIRYFLVFLILILGFAWLLLFIFQ